MAVAVLRMIHQSVHITTIIHSSEEDMNRPSNVLKASSSTLVSHLRQSILSSPTPAVERRPSRKREIARPPSSSQHSDGSILDWPELQVPVQVSLAASVPPPSSKKYAKLCQGLDADSRVLISGISAHPLGTELAARLGHECQVRHIHGILHQDWEADVLPRMAFLMKNHPNFTVHPDTLWSQQALDRLVETLAPTHVVHLETTTLSSPTNSSTTTISMDSAVRQSLLAIERIGRALGRLALDARVVHVTGKTRVLSPPLRVLDTAVLQTFPLEWQTFRQHFLVDIVQLELPPIYGPFTQSVLDADAILEAIDKEESSSTNNYEYSKDRPSFMIHVDDAVDTIVTTLTQPSMGSTELPILQVPHSVWATEPQIVAATMNETATTGTTRLLNDRSKLLLSWDHQNKWPFEDTNNAYGINDTRRTIVRKALAMTNRRLGKDKLIGISWLQRRATSLMPCTCECAENAPCLESTVWTKEILEMSRNLTEDCKFIIYTSELSTELRSLPDFNDSAKNNFQWPQETLCQVAYVSDKSALVERLQKANPNEEGRSFTLQHGFWTLVLVPGSESELPESDLMLPKMAPRPLFHRNVTKAMHLWAPEMLEDDGNQSRSRFPPRPIAWFLMSKHLDAKRQLARLRIGKRSGTSVPLEYWSPEVPARHISLFTNIIGTSSRTLARSSLLSMAKLYIEKQGRHPQDALAVEDDELPMRQLEYYQLAHETTYPITELPNTYMLIHSLETSQHSKRLRCEWYEEHLVWNQEVALPKKKKAAKRRPLYLEDLALAHLLAKRRAQGTLVPFDDEKWGERLVDTKDFYPAPRPPSLPNNETIPLPSQYFVKLFAPSKRLLSA